VFDKASKDKVMTGNTSGVQIFASMTNRKAIMQVLSIIDCPAEPHLFPILVKVNKISRNSSSNL